MMLNSTKALICNSYSCFSCRDKDKIALALFFHPHRNDATDLKCNYLITDSKFKSLVFLLFPFCVMPMILSILF